MAPSKRPGPAFSPPRPGKPKSKSKPNGTSKATTKEPTKKRGRPSKSTSKSTSSKRPRRSSLSDPDSDSNQLSDAASQSHTASDSESISPRADRSPSPDYVLVEAVPDTSTNTHIPNTLVHHILDQHFTKPETKITGDARDLLGVYVDTFVREAIIRCAFERGKQDGGDGGGGVGKYAGVGSEGWLEASDLERVGQQLVLDF